MPPAECEADACPGMLIVIVETFEYLEDAINIVRIDAVPFVADREIDDADEENGVPRRILHLIVWDGQALAVAHEGKHPPAEFDEYAIVRRPATVSHSNALEGNSNRSPFRN